MKKELQEILFESFPKIFERRLNKTSKFLNREGVNCGDGWFSLIYNLCEVIQSRIDQVNQRYNSSLERIENDNFEEENTVSFGYMPAKQIYVDEIKSKFDGLKFYLHEYDCDAFIIGAIAMAERQSRWVCQHCGEIKIHPQTHESCIKNENSVWIKEEK